MGPDQTDRASRVNKVTAGDVVTVYTYDQQDLTEPARAEHRGLLTKIDVTVSAAGQPRRTFTYTGAYNPTGQLSTQNLPGGIVQSTSYDSAGEPVERRYDGPVTDQTGTSTDAWLTWAQERDVLGRVRREKTPYGAAFTGPAAAGNTNPDPGDALGYQREFRYDPAGRLTTVLDETANQTGVDVTATPAPGTTTCALRTYGFDRNSNRISTATASSTTGTCPSAVTDTKTRSYDAADRLTTSANGANGAGAYRYDELGRVLTLPQNDTPNGVADLQLGYYDNDLPRSITEATTRTTFTLDTAGRRSTAVTGPVGGAVTSTLTRLYADGSDNPTSTLATQSGQADTTTRYTEDLDGDLGLELATTSGGTTSSASLPISNPHGDTVTTVTIPDTGNASSINGWSDYDEYGNPRTPSAAAAVAGADGYTWLGAKQRSATAGGLTLMGVRLYNPVTGQFTALDPIAGGNATSYGYPLDPVNRYDLDGRKGCSWRKPWECAAKAARNPWVQVAATAVGIGVCAFTMGVGCAIATGLSVAAASFDAYDRNCDGCGRRTRWGRALRSGAFNLGFGKATGLWRMGRAHGSLRKAKCFYRSGAGQVLRSHQAMADSVISFGCTRNRANC